MAFYPIRIQQCEGFGFVGGPEFQTDIKNAQNGREYRNGDWSVCRHKYTAPFAYISNEAYLAIKEVFLVVRGRLHTFLYRDPADHVADNATFGIGDGTQTIFQLSKLSQVGAATYSRVITKPVIEGLKIFVNGVQNVDVNVDPLTGLVTFIETPEFASELTWSGNFDVQVRFDIDYMPFSLDNANQNLGLLSNGSVDLYEVLDE